MMTGPSALQEATAAAIAMRWSLWLLTVPPQREGAGQWAAGPEGSVQSLFSSMISPSFVCLILVAERWSKSHRPLLAGQFPGCESLCASAIVDVPLAPESTCNSHDRHQIWKLCCTYCFRHGVELHFRRCDSSYFFFSTLAPIFSSTVMISLSLCVESGIEPSAGDITAKCSCH